MGVCLVTGGKSHYSGLCSFGAQDVKATIYILAYTGLRVKLLLEKGSNINHLDKIK